MDSPQSSWGGKEGAGPHALPISLPSQRSPSFFHPGSHLEGVERGHWGALKPPLKLYIQDVEQVRGLGLTRNVEAEVEAAYSTRAIVVELVGGAGY